MDIIQLGKSGLRVSRVCMGTMTFGREADKATSFRLMDRYLDLGGNLFDTANVYSNGMSEEVVGCWLKERGVRDRIVLATKVFGTMGPGPNDGGLSRIHIHRAVEDSLRRLQTDVIDLYQIHRWDSSVPVEETLGALEDLVRQGKVRYVGCSNLKGWHLSRYMHVARENGWTQFVSIQSVYNAINRSIESEVLEVCEAEGLGVISYNPLAGGMLTGKYKRGEELPSGARLAAFGGYYRRYFSDEALNLVERFVAAATERGVTPAQLALAWVLGEARVTCPIVGARNLEQFDDTVQGLDVRLSPEERDALPAVPLGRWVGHDPVYDRDA